ncbi:MAG: peptidylprolyl isomerase [Bacteroidetes bacterium]|nr:peptidylprolyl isomerase [Bacteroidota bacterium]MDA0875220.1 peptidylprolyl isomerase [Bacteroidota bacterium]
MRRAWFSGFLFSLMLLSACRPSDVVEVTIHTSRGDIEVAVDTVAAPVTSANFLRYVRSGFYDGGSFFRVVRMDNQPSDSIRIEVIQGGANRELEDLFFDPIPLERTSNTGLSHVDGTISMARGRPDTATDSFFFTIGNQPSLDFGGMRNPDGQGFAAFGRVFSGMDVIRSIQSDSTLTESPQVLRNEVVIDSIRVH